MIKHGDKVELDGVVASVDSIWAQGRHKKYTLSDGRMIMDLHLLIDSGKARLMVEPVIKPKPLRFDWKRDEQA